MSTWVGCPSPPVDIGDVMLCGIPLADIDNATCGNYSGSESYIVDCKLLTQVASQLVTV